MTWPPSIDEHAGELLRAAAALQRSAAQPGSSARAGAALARQEEALRALSAAWYQLAGTAVADGDEPREPIEAPSREEEMRLMAAMQDVGSALARAARVCRATRRTLHGATEPRSRTAPLRGRETAPV